MNNTEQAKTGNSNTKLNPVIHTGEASALEEIEREIMKMVDEAAAPNRLTVDTISRDPDAYIKHSEKMLFLARSRRIRAEALYQARRATEIEAFNERLLRLDQDHAKLIRNLSGVITKLEALRS